MKILHISDTHGLHHKMPKLPPADIIIHSGDFTESGSEEQAFDFINWFINLPYEHKIFIAGNHDECMLDAEKIEGLPEKVHYLSNSGCCIEGIKFYGIPMFMEDYNDGKFAQFFLNIPDDTDVLITHQPPFGICDLSDYGTGLKHHGNIDLLERVQNLHLHYHFFGHEHDANSVERRGNTVYSNAAIVDNYYELPEIIKPRLFIYK